jgi:hypothetical protein
MGAHQSPRNPKSFRKNGNHPGFFAIDPPSVERDKRREKDMIKYTIDQYAVQIQAGPVIGGCRAQFSCRSTDVVRGWILFYDDGTNIPDPTMDATNRISLSFPLSRYAAVMDMMRNEKPVSIYYHSASFAGMSVAGEPVGEAE